VTPASAATQPLRQLGWAVVGLLLLIGLVSLGGAALYVWPAALLLALALRGSTSRTVVVGLASGLVVAVALLVLLLV
jgi:hypothetical protein